MSNSFNLLTALEHSDRQRLLKGRCEAADIDRDHAKVQKDTPQCASWPSQCISRSFDLGQAQRRCKVSFRLVKGGRRRNLMCL